MYHFVANVMHVRMWSHCFIRDVKVQGVHAFGNSFYDLLHEGKLGKALRGGC